jgi:hypothetical protein
MGKITSIVAIILGVIGILTGSLISGLYAVCLGASLAVFELPWLYACVGPCKRLTVILNDNLYFHKAVVRAIAYVGLSVFLFWTGSFQIITGTLMLVCSLLYILSSVTGSELDVNPPAPSLPGIPGMTSAPATESTAFGTFS